MSRHGLKREAIVLNSRWNLDGRREAARQTVDSNLPTTAVHAGADIAALGMVSEWWERGQSAPQAYSLDGYHNSRTSPLGPIRLATVDQAGMEMGKRAGYLLVDRTEGRTAARHDVVKGPLLVRGTTARLA